MNDHEIPNIAILVADTENLDKYGRMRKQYLQEHKPGLYNNLLLTGTLHPHLLEIDQTARKRRWAGLMNTCKAQAEEVILSELIWG